MHFRSFLPVLAVRVGRFVERLAAGGFRTSFLGAALGKKLNKFQIKKKVNFIYLQLLEIFTNRRRRRDAIAAQTGVALRLELEAQLRVGDVEAVRAVVRERARLDEVAADAVEDRVECARHEAGLLKFLLILDGLVKNQRQIQENRRADVLSWCRSCLSR